MAPCFQSISKVRSSYNGNRHADKNHYRNPGACAPRVKYINIFYNITKAEFPDF